MLSAKTNERIAMMFAPGDRERAAALLLRQCGNNLPFLSELDAVALERYRFAALKLSEGQLDGLESAVRLAQTDWRDLLVAAGFADDVNAHESWMPERSRSE